MLDSTVSDCLSSISCSSVSLTSSDFSSIFSVSSGASCLSVVSGLSDSPSSCFSVLSSVIFSMVSIPDSGSSAFSSIFSSFFSSASVTSGTVSDFMASVSELEDVTGGADSIVACWVSLELVRLGAVGLG